jgi:hypothetical protein
MEEKPVNTRTSECLNVRHIVSKHYRFVSQHLEIAVSSTSAHRVIAFGLQDTIQSQSLYPIQPPILSLKRITLQCSRIRGESPP